MDAPRVAIAEGALTQLTSFPKAEPVAITSGDGVRLAGVHLVGAAAKARTAFAICHGFTHHTARPKTRLLLDAFAQHAPVVAFDLRGHGRSGGRSTVGDREHVDLDAAVGWAREAGYEQVVTVGFSLGGAVVLRHASLGAERPDAVVAVSPPARWYARETPALRRLHWLLEQPHGKAVARLLGVRLAGTWEAVPPSPVELVGSVAPTPLLLVQFAADRYFSPAHGAALAAASGGHAELWTVPGAGHGESGTSVAVVERIARWAQSAGLAVGARSDSSTVGGHAPARRRAQRASRQRASRQSEVG